MSANYRLNQFYKTKMCPWYYKGKCDRGKSCRFAHSNVEIRNLPDLSRTSLCPTFMKTNTCDDPKCRFAHNFDELRATDNMYKTSLCFMFMKSRCEAGDQCRHAHGNHELRSKPPGYEYNVKLKMKGYENNMKDNFMFLKDVNEEQQATDYIQRVTESDENDSSQLYAYLDKAPVSNQSTAYTTIEKLSKLDSSNKNLSELSNVLNSTWNSDFHDSQDDQDYYYVRVCPAISEPPISAAGRQSLESYMPSEYHNGISPLSKTAQITNYPSSNNTYIPGEKFNRNDQYLVSHSSAIQTPKYGMAKPSRNSYTKHTSALLHHIAEAARHVIDSKLEPEIGSSWPSVIPDSSIDDSQREPNWAQNIEPYNFNDCSEYTNSLENVYTNYLRLLSEHDSPKSAGHSLDDSKHLKSAISNILTYNMQGSDENGAVVGRTKSSINNLNTDINLQLANLLDYNSKTPENNSFWNNKSSPTLFQSTDDNNPSPSPNQKVYNKTNNLDFCIPHTPKSINV